MCSKLIICVEASKSTVSPTRITSSKISQLSYVCLYSHFTNSHNPNQQFHLYGTPVLNSHFKPFKFKHIHVCVCIFAFTNSHNPNQRFYLNKSSVLKSHLITSNLSIYINIYTVYMLT